jgi:hypothetical protein
MTSSIPLIVLALPVPALLIYAVSSWGIWVKPLTGQARRPIADYWKVDADFDPSTRRPPLESPPNRWLRAEFDAHGDLIPREYRPSFDQARFCVEGFLFPFLWPFSKGLILDGLKYTVIGGPAYFLLFLRSQEFSGLKLPLAANVAIAACIVAAHLWCGLEGYRKYTRFLNTSSPLKIFILQLIGGLLFVASLLWWVSLWTFAGGMH